MTSAQTLVVAGRDGQAPRELALARPHTPATSPLRAWSAADELVLAELAAVEPERMLIVNDEFGALACGFAHHRPFVWVDSALRRTAIEANLSANDLPAIGDRLVPGNQAPAGPFDVVVLRVPKSLALLEWQLHHVAHAVTSDAIVVGAAMARHIQQSTRHVFEQAIGPTEVSRATRKARLIHSQPSTTASAAVAMQPQPFELDDGTVVAQRPGVFSSGHLDSGTAELLRHVEVGDAAHVLDLGCGNGVVAASLARQHKSAHFTLTDVSDLAIEAARETWLLNDLDDERAQLIVADGIDDLPDRSFDLAVSNPPFHQGHAVDELLAERLLGQTARVLTNGGRLVAVGQRDLHLHTRLRRWFDEVRVVSKHAVFVVIEASQPRRAHQ